MIKEMANVRVSPALPGLRKLLLLPLNFLLIVPDCSLLISEHEITRPNRFVYFCL